MSTTTRQILAGVAAWLVLGWLFDAVMAGWSSSASSRLSLSTAALILAGIVTGGFVVAVRGKPLMAAVAGLCMLLAHFALVGDLVRGIAPLSRLVGTLSVSPLGWVLAGLLLGGAAASWLGAR